MRFRISPAAKGFTLSVENEEGALFSLPAASIDEAKDLARVGMREGIDAIRPAEPAAKKKATKKKATKK